MIFMGIFHLFVCLLAFRLLVPRKEDMFTSLYTLIHCSFLLFSYQKKAVKDFITFLLRAFVLFGPYKILKTGDTSTFSFNNVERESPIVLPSDKGPKSLKCDLIWPK